MTTAEIIIAILALPYLFMLASIWAMLRALRDALTLNTEARRALTEAVQS